MGRTAVDILVEHGVELSDDELAHYGKLGMKWGRRKKRDSSESSSAPAKPSVKSMSDEELKSAINRLKLEKEYATLTAPQVSAGKKIVMDLLKDIGKQQAKTFINKNLESLLYPPKDDTATKVAKVATKSITKAIAQRPTVKLNYNHGLKL